MFKYIILASLLTPRLEILSIGGVNSDLRIDVLVILAVSLIPLLKPLKRYQFNLILGILTLCLMHSLLFSAQVSRIIVGGIFYISFVLYSGYKNILKTEDLLQILKIFMIFNILLHLSDIAVNINSNHNLSFRYGVFNQHFAFATSIVICYCTLKIFGASSTALGMIFWCGLLLSGSRGILLAVILVTIFEKIDFRSIKLKNVLISFAFLAIVAGLLTTFRDNANIIRALDLMQLLIESSGDIVLLASDPALNVRLENAYNYVNHVQTIDKGWLYILIGGGPYNFLDYSVQFGKPGHFDNTYLRLISEFGLISIAVFFGMLLYLIIKVPETVSLVGILLIGGLVSEAAFTAKVGHLLFLTYVFLLDKRCSN